MPQDLWALGVGAVSIAFVHTLAGPDHYLPFAALARAGRWGRSRTMGITLLCGLGHVASSVVLGLAGVSLASALEKLERIESVRGEIAAWLLIGFGVAYLAWALRELHRGRRHTHVHVHADGTIHAHEHTHRRRHAHLHAAPGKERVAWVLFLVFVFGPCEPLIPLVTVAALEHGWVGVLGISGLFGVVTLATMSLAVLVLVEGSARLEFRLPGERYAHVFAGAVVLGCGLAVRFLGL